MEVKMSPHAFDSIINEDKNIPTMEVYVEEVKERIINEEQEEFDNIFTSHQYIEDSSFADFIFVGKYKGQEVVWNACITTARGDYYEEIDGNSLDKSYEKYPNPEDFDFIRDCFVSCDDGTGNSLFIDPHPELSEKRTRYHSKLTIEELDKKEFKLDPWDIEIDESYEYGIGLHVRMNIESINVNDVKEFISQFQEHGMDAFSDSKYDKEQICLNAEEMGVKLTADSDFVQWTKQCARGSVAITLTEEDLLNGD